MVMAIIMKARNRYVFGHAVHPLNMIIDLQGELCQATRDPPDLADHVETHRK